MRVPGPMPLRQPQAAGRALRVALVCRDPELRAGIHAALNDEHNICTVATSERGQAMPLVRASAPDVVLMDFDGPDVSALETCRSLIREAPLTRIVAMPRECDDERLLRSALMAGVRGYLARSAEQAELVSAIRAVAEGAVYVGQAAAWLMTGLLSARPQLSEHDALSALTRREREILELVARGYDNRRIARVLTLAEKTVRNNVSSVFSKIGVTRRAQAVVCAREAGFGLT